MGIMIGFENLACIIAYVLKNQRDVSLRHIAISLCMSNCLVAAKWPKKPKSG